MFRIVIVFIDIILNLFLKKAINHNFIIIIILFFVKNPCICFAFFSEVPFHENFEVKPAKAICLAVVQVLHAMAGGISHLPPV